MNEDADPFTQLGCEPRFALSNELIRQRQRASLALSHPDRTMDPMRRAEAMRASAAISAAARTLLDPVTRAETLLRMAACDAAPSPSPALLMSSLDWRDEIEHARASHDLMAMAAARRPVESRMAEVLSELTEAIDGTAATGTSTMMGDRSEVPTRADHLSAGRPRVADPPRAGALLTELRMLRRLLEVPEEQGP